MSMIPVITGFTLLALAIAAVLFFISGKTRDRSVLYWGFCWIFYSASLFCYLMFVDGRIPQFMEIKKIFDMYSILFLLFGIYHFSHVKIPGFWMRFSIYLSIWVGIAVYFKIDQLSTAIPVFAFDLLAVAAIGYAIYRYWERAAARLVYMGLFLSWGLAKAFLALYEVRADYAPGVYIAEILFANLIIVFIFIIYLDRMRREMTKTEERFRVIVENASDAIFYFALEPRPAFLYITPSVEEITGIPPQAFYKDARTILELVPESQMERYDRFLFSGLGSVESLGGTFPLNHPKHGKIWIEVHFSGLEDSGRPAALEGTIRDVTHLKQIEEDLLTSKKSRDLLLSYISHELKTPITSILGYVTAVRDGTIDTEEEKDKALEIIAQKSLILERMIQDLFQLSQLETNQYSFNFSIMDCYDLCEYLKSRNVPELKGSGLDFKVEMDKENLEGRQVMADPVRLNQVVSNLIVNAIKHQRKNGQIRVRCGIDGPKASLVLTVWDNGAGIPKEDLPHIFDRFYKAKSAPGPAAPGRGLGLTLSKEIVEAHHGAITAKSTFGRGSTFTVSLPLYEENQGEPPWPEKKS